MTTIGNIVLEAAEVTALLECVPGPVLLIRDSDTMVCSNAAAVELNAWFAGDDPSRELSAQLLTTMCLARSTPEQRQQATLTLQSPSLELRHFRPTVQHVLTPSSTETASTIIVLSQCADPEAALQSPPQINTAQTQLEEVQQQLLQADRMSSIGQLAAGVAHEINNPIGYIQSNLGILADYVTSLFRLLGAQESALRNPGRIPQADLMQIEDIRQQIDLDFLSKDLPMLLVESQEGIGRVRKIVNDLRDFSRAGQSDALVYADIHSGLDSTINIVWNDLKYKVELVRRYGEIPLIECLPSQLNQVFMNILVNAGHAIEGHGQIFVVTRADEHWVYVEISDTGKGISQEYLQRIFEPFFTTKVIGQGTGLGLSISYGIVKKHGGEIDVRSEIGVGTTFVIKLPINRSTAGQAIANPHGDVVRDNHRLPSHAMV